MRNVYIVMAYSGSISWPVAVYRNECEEDAQRHVTAAKKSADNYYTWMRGDRTTPIQDNWFDPYMKEKWQYTGMRYSVVKVDMLESLEECEVFGLTKGVMEA